MGKWKKYNPARGEKRLVRKSVRVDEKDWLRAQELRIPINEVFRLTLKRMIMLKEMALLEKARLGTKYRAPRIPTPPPPPPPRPPKRGRPIGS